jgi:hypothetical protein
MKAILEMEMPEYCNYCMLFINDFTWCRAAMRDLAKEATDRGGNTIRPAWCPLRLTEEK